MKHFNIIVSFLFLLTACGPRDYVQNPDPNHTHADFAVWIDDTKLDFTADEFMSGVSYDEASHDEEDEYHHEHLHLHDNVGHVVHRHKPGLTLQEFFTSLDIRFTEKCMVSPRGWTCSDDALRMFIGNPATERIWEEVAFDTDYLFEDMDMILLTSAASDEKVQMQIEQMTDDACLYSRTCPWRGDPPAENCVADPAVPCIAPLE